MTKIALVDFSGLYRRHWAILKDGEDLGAAARNTVRDITTIAGQYDHVGICIDSPPYTRSERFPAYKSGREEQPAACYELADRALCSLEDDGFPIFGHKGAEADDIIASLVRALKDDHDDWASVVIFSSDKDTLSLVDEFVAQWSFALDRMLGEAEVIERYGVKPSMMPDLLALAGDSSDGIPGVRGIGAKTAAKLLTEYGGLEAVAIAAQDGKLTPAKNEAIKEADLQLSFELVSLDDGLPVDVARLFEARERKEPEAPSEPISDDPGPTPPEPVKVRPEPVQTALATRDRDHLSPYSIEPVDKAEAWKLAQMAIQSRATNFPNPESALLAIMAGRVRGIDAFTSLQSFHVIKGRVTPSAQMLQALVMKSPECEYFQMLESSDKLATYETKRRGAPAPTRLTYTMEQATAAGLTGKDNWKGNPDDMLRARCVSKLARVVYPDVTIGLYASEEF